MLVTIYKFTNFADQNKVVVSPLVSSNVARNKLVII